MSIGVSVVREQQFSAQTLVVRGQDNTRNPPLRIASDIIGNPLTTIKTINMKENIIIKRATKDDCKTLANVIETVVQAIPYYNDLAKQSEIAKFQTSDLISKIEADKHSVIIATINDEIVGFCMTRFDDYIILLEWFGVLETHRGKGIANLLLTALNETISIRQCHKIWCDCRTSNKASIHILTNHGFKQLVTILNHWYKQDFILWEKEINR